MYIGEPNNTHPYIQNNLQSKNIQYDTSALDNKGQQG